MSADIIRKMSAVFFAVIILLSVPAQLASAAVENILWGEVGIGTGSPGAPLDVKGSADGKIRIYGTAGADDAILEFLNQGAASTEGFRILYDNDVGDTYLDNIWDGGVDTNPAIRFRTKTAGTAVNAMTITHGGNVGIGTASPGAKLDVYGVVKIRDGATDDITISPTATGGVINIRNSAGTSVINLDARDAGNAVFFNHGGNVGIGTANPGSYKLYVNGNQYINGRLTFVNDQDIFGIDQLVGYNDLRFYTDNAGSTEHMRLWNSGGLSIGAITDPGTDSLSVAGNVGIGTTSPIEKLHVNGNIGYFEGSVVADSSGENLIPNWEMESDTAWADAPEQYELADFDGVEHYVHRSVESGTSCYNWALTDYIPANPNKLYKFTLWIKSTETDLNNYFGFYIYDSSRTRISSGGWSNPYFKTSESDSNEWRKWTAYLGPSYAGIETGCDSSKTNGNDFCMASNTAFIQMRFGTCYGDGSNTGYTYFAYPKIEAIDPDDSYMVGDFVIMSGDLGIGTTNPSYDFDVRGTGYFSGDVLLAGNDAALTISDGGSNTHVIDNCDTNELCIESQTYINLDASENGDREVEIREDKINLLDTTEVSSGNFYVTTGNVGIGTTVPNQNLQIGARDVPGITGIIRVATEQTGGGGNRAWDFSTSHSVAPNYGFFIKDVSLANPSFVIEYSSGDVGIGTTVPGGPLELHDVSRGSWNDGLIIEDEAGWAATVYRRGTAAKMFTGLYSGNDNFIWMAPGYSNTGTAITAPRADAVLMARPATDDLQIYLDTHFGGDVGIGTTSPSHKLDVSGSAQITSVVASEKDYDSLDDGLILYLPFSTGSGSTAYDRSKSGIDATLTTVTWADGKLGKTMSIDNAGYATVPANPVFNFGTGDWTFSMWVYSTALTSMDTVFAQTGPYYILRLDANHWDVYHAGTHYSTPDHGMVINQWYFITLERKSNVLYVYQNGVQLWSQDVTGQNTNMGNALWLIGDSTWAVEHWSKYIDEFRVHNRALSADEIREYYQKGLGTQEPYVDIVTGNVGIGTTSPTGKLDVRGDEVRIWTGAGTNTNALASGELYVEGDLEVDGVIYPDGGISGYPDGSGTANRVAKW